jgi:hypothetical protein
MAVFSLRIVFKRVCGSNCVFKPSVLVVWRGYATLAIHWSGIVPECNRYSYGHRASKEVNTFAVAIPRFWSVFNDDRNMDLYRGKGYKNAHDIGSLFLD